MTMIVIPISRSNNVISKGENPISRTLLKNLGGVMFLVQVLTVDDDVVQP